jgi:hypothetical protein
MHGRITAVTSSCNIHTLCLSDRHSEHFNHPLFRVYSTSCRKSTHLALGLELHSDQGAEPHDALDAWQLGKVRQLACVPLLSKRFLVQQIAHQWQVMCVQTCGLTLRVVRRVSTRWHVSYHAPTWMHAPRVRGNSGLGSCHSKTACRQWPRGTQPRALCTSARAEEPQLWCPRLAWKCA